MGHFVQLWRDEWYDEFAEYSEHYVEKRGASIQDLDSNLQFGIQNWEYRIHRVGSCVDRVVGLTSQFL